MHFKSTFTSCDLMKGDCSACLWFSREYLNEPSLIDGVMENGLIFYLALLVCNGSIYLVDGIIVSKKCEIYHHKFHLTWLPPRVCIGKCSFIYPFVISIVILWRCSINWTASTAQQSKTQYIYYKGSVPETLLNRLTNQRWLREEPHHNVTQSL